MARSEPAVDTCLVTGGAGFIGSHLTEHLVRSGRNVVVIDNLSTGSRDNLKDVDPKKLSFIEDDLVNGLRAIERRGDRFTAIYHLAAAVGVRLVIERPIQTIETNVLDTCELLRFADAHSTPTLIASTSEVYGKGTRTPFAEDDDVRYGPTRFSRWSYASSKAIDEYLALAYQSQHGLPVIVMRFFNTVGPRQVGEYGMVLPRFVLAALSGQPIEVYGDGRQSRCFCDVRDVAPALPRILEHVSTSRTTERPDVESGKTTEDSPVFNIGRDDSITIRELADLVKKTLKSESPIAHIPYEQAFGEGFDDLRTRQPDLSRIRRAISFEPKIPLEQTICDLASHLNRTGRNRSEDDIAVASKQRT